MILRSVERKLGGIYNRKTNKKIAVRLIIESAVFAVLYLCYCFYFLFGVWYMNGLIIVSTILCILNYLDIRVEIIKNRLKTDVPKTIRKLRYYLIQTKSLSRALQKTVAKTPETTKGYILKLQEAVSGANEREAFEALKNSTGDEWFKILCSLVYYCKLNGDSDQSISKNLNKVTTVIEFINLQQGLDNAELIMLQVFTAIIPLAALPLIQWFHMYLLEAFDQPELFDIYAKELNINVIIAAILFFSNVSMAFIGWIRKSS